jgi:hypothetical protein
VGSNPAIGMNVSLLSLFLLSGRGLCNWLITHPAECGVSEHDREVSIMRGTWPTGGHEKGKLKSPTLILNKSAHFTQAVMCLVRFKT